MIQISDEIESSAEETANILFRTPPLAPSTDQTCARLLEGANKSPDRILYITYTWSSHEKLVGWESHGDEVTPAKTGIIVVGDHTQSPTVSGSTITTQSANSIRKTVADPTDLTSLSTELSTFFEAWGTTDGQLSLCFDSITPLLMYVSIDKSSQFLDVLTSRVETLGATAHYHLDPDAHTTQTVDRLIPLFDEVVDCTEKK